MADLLETPYPVGTPAELEEAGINPKLNGSCAPSENNSGFKGCSYYADCIFARPHADGKVLPIRDHGAKNIGYSIHLSDWGPERPANEDWMPCHRFMATMHRRMVHGVVLRETSPSKPREEIKIIANEGEVIWIHQQVSKVPGSKTQLGLESKDLEFRIPIHPRPSQLLAIKGPANDIASKREMERALLDNPTPEKAAKKSA
jgi:hypothetical protein